MRIILAALMTFLIAILSGSLSSAKEMNIPACETMSEGIFKGLWVKHRILIEYKTVYGANDMDSILSQLDRLRSEGLCQ